MIGGLAWRVPLRRVGIWVAAVAGALLVIYAVLAIIARFRLDERDPAPFFAPATGDGERPALVVAHQGGELLRPSNTMVAFRHAAELGADVLDADVHRTADGALVLIHDETVDRTSDGTGAVGDLTLVELRELDFGYRFSEDGSTFPYRGRGVGIVTVDELFRAFPDGMRFGLEIKRTAPEAADELCQAIRDAGYEDQVLISSFAQGSMDAFRLACPEVATSATKGEVRTFYILHRLRLNGLVAPPYDAFQVPEHSGGLRIVSARFVRDAAAWGLPVIPWTIDDPDDMDRLLGLGVAGINTNRPDLLIDLVDERQ